jgi:hypothetical protein
MGSKSTAPPFLIPALAGGGGTSFQIHASATLTEEKDPSLLFEEAVGWALESVWMVWSKEKYLALAGNQTPTIHPVTCRYTD